ncbi:MAG: DUF983 domain-containing protein [Chloroflexi bacterium]|nr:DUF983 domain-containing protein [Chloroflexota bacterium]
MDGSRAPSGAGRALILFSRALLLRCPVCGGDRLFRSWFSLKERCPTCGFVFGRGETGYQLGSMALNLIVPLVLWVVGFFAILLTTWPSPPWFWLQWGSVAFMILFPLLFFPLSHTLATALDVLVRPPGHD